MGDINSFVTQAIAASIYVSPTAAGVTPEELAELAARCGILKGELSDFLNEAGARLGWNDGKYLGTDTMLNFESTFHWKLDPEYRNVDAFEFVLDELKHIARQDGMAKARVARDVLVARGQAKQLDAHDLQVAITLLAGGKFVALEGDAARLTQAGKQYASPRLQLEQQDVEFRRPRPLLDTCVQALREIRARADAGSPVRDWPTTTLGGSPSPAGKQSAIAATLGPKGRKAVDAKEGDSGRLDNRADRRERPKYQIFISSPFLDLEKERKAVIFEILAARHIPAGMEGFPAGDDRGWKTIQRTIDVSDYYVVILGGLYGSIDPETRLSWTEREYDYARRKHLKVLAFLRELKHVRGDMVETDPERKAKLDSFRLKLKEAHLVKDWTYVDDLRAKVVQALNAQIQDDVDEGNPRPGWYRGDEVPEVRNLQMKLDEERARARRAEQELDHINTVPRLKSGESSANQRVLAEALVDNQTLTIGLARKPQGVDPTRVHFAGNLNANADGVLKRVRFHACDDFLVESIILQGRSLFHGAPTEPALLDRTEFSARWPSGPELIVTLWAKSAT